MCGGGIGTMFPVIAEVFPDVICHSAEHSADQVFRLDVLECMLERDQINIDEAQGNVHHDAANRLMFSQDIQRLVCEKEMYAFM